MKIRAFSSREKFILRITLITGVVSLLLYGWFLASDKLVKLDDDIEKKRDLLQKYLYAIGEKDRGYAEYRNYMDVLEDRRSPGEVETQVFKEVKNLAQSFNLTIERIKPLPLKETKKYKEILLEVELGGTFAPLFQFINKLENSPSFIRILSLRLYPQSGMSFPLRCRITLSRVIFE
jgi:Tfp pilus assembly protein PilO